MCVVVGEEGGRRKGKEMRGAKGRKGASEIRKLENVTSHHVAGSRKFSRTGLLSNSCRLVKICHQV